MYRHILIPTDGSPLSDTAVAAGVALVLGSETTKVLTHSKIPVLVCR